MYWRFPNFIISYDNPSNLQTIAFQQRIRSRRSFLRIFFSLLATPEQPELRVLLANASSECVCRHKFVAYIKSTQVYTRTRASQELIDPERKLPRMMTNIQVQYLISFQCGRKQLSSESMMMTLNDPPLFSLSISYYFLLVANWSNVLQSFSPWHPSPIWWTSFTSGRLDFLSAFCGTCHEWMGASKHGPNMSKSQQREIISRGCSRMQEQKTTGWNSIKKMWSICSVSKLAIAHNNSSCFFRSCRPSFRWYSWKWIFHCVEKVIVLICRSLCSWSFCLRFLLAGKLNNLMGEGNVATSNQCNFV